MCYRTIRKVAFFIFGFFLLFFSNATFANELKSFNVGAFSNFPVIFKDTDGTAKGLYVDLLNEIGRKENISFNYVFGTWNDGLERIKTGEVDLLTSVGYTEERSGFMDFTETPLLIVWGELYAHPSSEIKSFLDISKKRIGVMKGDINYANFKDLVYGFNISCDFVEYNTYDEVFAAVADKKIDAGIAGITFGGTNKVKYNLKSTGIVFSPLNLYFTTAKNKNPELLALLDKNLKEWREDDDSFFWQTKNKWLFSPSFPVTNIIPAWIKEIILVLGIVILVITFFVTLLNFRVRQATKKIRQQAEELHSSELMHKVMTANISDVICIVDVEGKIKYVSPNLNYLFGFDSESTLGLSVWERVHPDDREFLKEKFSKIIEKVGSKEKVEFRHAHKDGHWSVVELTATNMAKDPYIGGILINYHDITDRKKAEDDIKIKFEEIEKMNKLMVGREIKMMEMKKELEFLREKYSNQ